jgi:hypothetical protein
MSLLPLVLASLIATGLWHQPQTEAPGKLRWVRGTVTSVTASSLTLKLRDSSVTLAIDAATTPSTAALSAGSTIEAHFTDRKGDRRAVLLLTASTGQLSKRFGQSYRGIVERTKRGTLSLRVEGRKRGVSLDKVTKLFASDGTALGSGSKEVSAQLKAGEMVLVTYDEVSSDIPAGDIVIPSSSERALEIRRLAQAGL